MTMKSPEEFQLSTQLTLLGRDPQTQFGFVNGAVWRGSTIIYPTCEAARQRQAKYYYGTAGSPTIENLENAWSVLCGAAGTVISPSGLGALALALMSVTGSGDHLLIPDSVYRPTRNLRPAPNTSAATPIC